MKPAICEQYGIDFPLFAFSHCRDVVAAVTNAGGFGVLGATAFTPELLDQELSWIDDHVGGKSYGLDLIVPAKFEGKGEKLSRGELADRIPEDYRGFVADLLAAHDIEPEASPRTGPSFLSGDTGQDLLEVAMSHPIKLIANALGVPPDYMIEAGKERGMPVAALVGAKEHAVKQVQAGVDLIVAQGTEAGGHCGEVTTMVLIPEVIEAHRRRSPGAGRRRDRHGQADGGVGRDGRRRGVDGVGLADDRGGRDGAAYRAEVPGGVVARHDPVGRADRKACAATGFGLDGRVAAARGWAASRCRCRCSRCWRSRSSAGSTCWRRRAIRARRRWPPTSSGRASD